MLPAFLSRTPSRLRFGVGERWSAGGAAGGWLLGQGLAEAFGEGEDPDAFEGKGVGVGRVELAASLGITEAEPVGGLVAGSREARLLYEGLDQDGTKIGRAHV